MAAASRGLITTAAPVGDALDVVLVAVGDERVRHVQAARVDLAQQAIDLPRRVDDRRRARLGAKQDLAEVLQQADLDLDDLGRARQTGDVARRRLFGGRH
jgi:hypothetical protein